MTDLAPLTADERSALARYETTICEGLQTFFEVGAALLGIKNGRLYRETHATWYAYCQERWGFSDRKAYYMIVASEAVGKIAETRTIVPTHESQIRPIATDPQVVEIWNDAVAQHGDQPTARQVVETKIKRQVYAAGFAPVIQKMTAGELTPKQALVLADTLGGCEPRVRGDVLRAGVTDPGVIRKLNDLGRRGSETYREIVGTGYLQFKGEDDAVALPAATLPDLTRLLADKQRQRLDERFGDLQPVTVTLFGGNPDKTISEIRKMNLPPHYLDLLVTVSLAL